MKSILKSILAVFLLLGLTACSQNDTNNQTVQQKKGNTNPSSDSSQSVTTSSKPADTVVSSSQCRKDPLAGVYHPNRLKIMSECKTVSGTVASIKNEKDDDYHINLHLDPEYANLINEKNMQIEHGNLVVEVIPMDRVNISRPTVGEKLTVTGAYVMDGEHGWMEIHPAWIVNNQGTIDFTQEAAKKSVTEGVCGNGDRDCEGGSETDSGTSSSSVKIINVSSPVSRGSEASVSAQVSPGASASITVYYHSGPSHAAGLEPKNADGGGSVSWQWKVGMKTDPGTYQIVISSGGQNITANFTVE